MKYPEYATLSDDVLVARVLGKYPEYRARVDPRAVAEASHRFDEEIGVQKRVTTITHEIVTQALVREKRTMMARIALAAWALPAAVLYALGWSVGWIRRGFKQVPPPSAD
jgi:hypothetical protein